MLSTMEAPSGCYPVTSALVGLTNTLLQQHYVEGPMTALVMFCLLRVLGSMGWLTFAAPAPRWQLAAELLQMLRLALGAGAHGEAAAAPKGTGWPSGMRVTALAAAVLQHLATAGGWCWCLLEK
jgi:hypothetical protein